MGKSDYQHLKGCCRIWRFADLLMSFQQHLPRTPQLGDTQITERSNTGAFTLDQIGKICAGGSQTRLMDDVQQVGDDHFGFSTILVHPREL